MVNGTTKIGYVNPKGQKVLAATGLPGTHSNQKSYRLECLNCDHIYLANGCDIYERRGPSHDNGAPGDELP